MFYAKQSTAKTCIVGPILDSAGAEYASAVIGDLSISKNGGTLTAMASAATLTYIANGMYTLVMTTGNLDTLGTAEISCNKAGYQMRQKEFQVLPATVYDALVTNAVNATGGLTGATGAITGLAGVIATTTNITAGTMTTTTNLTNPPYIVTGTADSGTTTTLVDAARTEADTNYWKGQLLEFTSGTLIGQTRLITGFVPGTDTITFAPAVTQAVSTHTYRILPFAGADLQLFLGATPGAATIPTVAEIRTEMDDNSTKLAAILADTAEIGAAGAGLTALATAAQVSSLQVNTRTNIQVPIEIEIPDASTQVWKIRLFLFDIDGNMESPDSTPTIALTNAAGTDRSSRLSAATTLSAGAYSWDYTATAGDAEEQLVWIFTVVEGGLTRIYPATSYVVEETAYRFSSTDRSTLNAAATATALAAVNTKIGTPAGASMSADIAAEAVKTASIQTEVNKIPRKASAITAGAAATLTITGGDSAAVTIS